MSISHFPIAAARLLPHASTKGRVGVALEADGSTPDGRRTGIATRAPPIEDPRWGGAPETEFRRGWPAVLACFCVAVFAWGFGFYGQAVFLAELHRLHGWPASTISAATTVFYLCGALLMPFIQQTLDRTGARALLIGGVLLLGLGAAGFSNAAEPWQLFAAGVVMAAGWAASSGPAISKSRSIPQPVYQVRHAQPSGGGSSLPFGSGGSDGCLVP